MKGVTLQTFEKLEINRYGVMTIDKRIEARMIKNKGTIVRAIVSDIKVVVEMMGIGDTPRARRWAESLNVFRPILQRRYGEANAHKALRDSGLDKKNRLDARSIRRALDAALSERYQILVETTDQRKKF